MLQIGQSHEVFQLFELQKKEGNLQETNKVNPPQYLLPVVETKAYNWVLQLSFILEY